MGSADRFNIDKGYNDALGNWREAPDETCDVLRAAMGQPTTRKQEDEVWVVRRGQSRKLRAPGELALEDGAVLRENLQSNPLAHTIATSLRKRGNMHDRDRR